MEPASLPFLGRRHELSVMDEAFTARGSAFVPIYGRRRVGKSELILHFMRAKPGLYFLGKQADAALQRKEFMEVAARALEEPLLASASVPDWKTAFESVLSRKRKDGRKFIVALDEFQWMVESSPELPSVLQELWDRRWRPEGGVFLILCGSYVGFMEREVLGRKSPLFGRRTGQILLRPFSYREAAGFHPAYSTDQKAATYFICGGVPLYLSLFSPRASVAQNIEKTLLDEYAPLFREADFLLREELREVEKYYAVLLALSSGALPSRDIALKTGIGDRSLPYYLQTLQELGYVARRYPMNGAAPAKRHVRFALADPLLRFWFHFIYPHQSLISRWGPQKAFQELVRPGLDAYFGLCFENLCRESLPLLYAREKMSSAYEVGDYWDKNVQIDVVGLREDGWIDLGECKWGNVPSAKSLTQEIARKASLFPNPGKRTIQPRLFTRHAPRSAPSDEIRWHSLEEIYSL